MIIEIQNREIEAKIRTQAQALGVSIEEFIARLIEDGNRAHVDAPGHEDPRLNAMREAVNDPLFMADLREAMEDFQYADAEYNH